MIGTEVLHRHVADAGLTVLNGTPRAVEAEVVIVGGTDRFLRQAAEGGGSEREILERFARLADRGGANGRRTRILNDASFSDAPPTR